MILAVGVPLLAALGRADGLPPSEQDPETVRETAERILADPAYRPPRRSIVERVIDWIGDRFADLFERFGVGGGGGGGGLVPYAILIVVVGFLVWVLTRADWSAFRRGARRRGDEGPVVVLESDVDAATLRRRAADAEAGGAYREALRLWFAALVAELVAADVAEAVPGRTAAEYRTEVTAARPAAGPALARAVTVFEDVWYGHLPVDAATCEEMRGLTGEVLAAVARPVAVGVAP